jgi:hypothetical protein
MLLSSSKHYWVQSIIWISITRTPLHHPIGFGIAVKISPEAIASALGDNNAVQFGPIDVNALLR